MLQFETAKLSIEDMPQYDECKDESQNTETFPALDKEPEVTTECRGPVFKCRDITPEKGQNGQRPHGKLLL